MVTKKFFRLFVVLALFATIGMAFAGFLWLHSIKHSHEAYYMNIAENKQNDVTTLQQSLNEQQKQISDLQLRISNLEASIKRN